MGRLPILKSPLTKAHSHRGDHVNEPAELNTQDESLFENPQFEHYEATSNIQLFFDLFFVANLSSFTSVHEINSRDTLASYIGFICVLWFTWCQVTLYDVRFATDSIFERIAHACHFGVMVGLAVIGPNFLTPDGWGPLQQLSLILMVSRVILLCQYGSTLFFTWRYRKTRAPLIVVMMSLVVAVFVYLGISFAFYKRTAYDAYIAWYVLAVAEVVLAVAVAALWPAVSLWKTHLVERMTCLTLIILGEGIIGLTGTIGKIQKLDGKFTATDIGTLISAVLIIYLIYQLYFDSIRLEPISGRRQHLSAILHFPFHLALCLAMEGTNQVLLWVHISGDIGKIFDPFLNALLDGTTTTPQLQTIFTEMLNDVFSRFDTTDVVFNEVQHSLNETLALPATADPSELLVTGLDAVTEAMKTVIEGFGWEAPTEIEGEGIEGLEAAFTAFTSVFKITFGYFTICTGLILIFIAVFSLLSLQPGSHHSSENRLRYICTGTTMAVGLGIALLSLTTRSGAGENLGESPWAIAGLMLILLALLVLNHLPRGYYHVVVEKHV
ncbi:bacterial low temperature requirement A protein-domain-containing protein [Aspergillus pseudodeflectus]|uniref:Bacterial low temperature requirement A protein-domain-containing protein n=1 Tax=Aspergillus pseudodeflectus TaxID=176178 RepID=A0ABR4JCL8_9EURO